MAYQYRLTVVQTDGNTDLQDKYTDTIYSSQEEAQSTAESILSENSNISFQVQEEYVEDVVTS